ncbi:hypothetical protein KC19_3G189400 [Ceratodon purpureus]|uniref:SET domain-containing protein n=2 Tax=Ceratodon purpureus TaxID=3225 RepID=A0A8T0IMU5_CERPU|nr:hypothetical protein KC19_3G189400 [Ceratodon purpureus]
MGTLSEEQLAVFHEDGYELGVTNHLTEDQIGKFKKAFDGKELEVVERSAEYRFVRATRDIQVGTVLGIFDGTIQAKCARYTISLGDNVHVVNHTPLILINHSCSPNTALQWSAPPSHESSFSSLAALAGAHPEQVFPLVVAIASISKGEEVTWNYLSSEWELSCPFDCQCRSRSDLCVGKVLGAKHLTSAQKTRMSPLMAPHILKKMAACESDIAVDRLSVCVLGSSYANGKDALGKIDDYQRNPGYVNHCHNFEYHGLSKDDCYAETRKLIKSGKYDVFFNLCDGALDATTAGIDVIRALETYDAAFTGAGVKQYEPTKIEMKLLAADAGINVPPYFVFKNREDIESIEELFGQAGLTFPVIVKHISGYSSIGMTRSSRCSDFKQLRLQSSELLETYGEGFVENFIEGEEITVLAFEGPCVLEPFDMAELQNRADAVRFQGHGPMNNDICTTLVPVTVRFPSNETFKHFDMKWTTNVDMKWERITGIAKDLACRDVGLKAFKAVLRGMGYGRTDLRIDADGKIWFLEINPNCGLFYPAGCASADIILKNDEAVGAERFVNLMIAAATRRQMLHKLARPCFDVVFCKMSGGHTLRANRLIRENELILAEEGRAFHLVSLKHVENNWPEEDKVVFRRYSWPLSKHLYAIWSDDPSTWRPINHSCDPTCWFGPDHSLNVFARRNLAKGQEITIDYSTYCSPDAFEPFECHCGTSKCRKVITKEDLPDMAAKYGTRVTAFLSGC